MSLMRPSKMRGHLGRVRPLKSDVVQFIFSLRLVPSLMIMHLALPAIRMSRVRRVACGLFGPLASAVICITVWTSWRGNILAALSRSDGATISCVDLLGDFPLKLRPMPMKCASGIKEEVLRQYSDMIAVSPPGEPEPSARARLVHLSKLSTALVVSGPTLFHRDNHGRINRVSVATSALSISWRGLEIVDGARGRPTEHRDQLLSALAESGVPLNALLDTKGGTFTVRDLLRTSVNEFHIAQEEIEWSAVAYAHYLPPQSHWRNRLGEAFSFDDLATELMARPLNRGSCRGIHLLTSLTTLLLCDHEKAILSASMRDSISSHLKHRVRAAVASQQPDGHWPLAWAPDFYSNAEGRVTPPLTLEMRVVISGHMIEWFHWLPASLKPPKETVHKGLAALLNDLEESPREAIIEGFCPYTHAVMALYLADFSEDSTDTFARSDFATLSH
jgi:hypothetical protein